MSNIEQSAKGKKDGDIRYLTPLNIETNKTKNQKTVIKCSYLHLKKIKQKLKLKKQNTKSNTVKHN